MNERVEHLGEHKGVKRIFTVQLVFQDLADYHDPVGKVQHHVKTIGITGEIRCDFINRVKKLPLQPIHLEYNLRRLPYFFRTELNTEGIARYFRVEFRDLRDQQVIDYLLG